jgi:hypothetical protein
MRKAFVNVCYICTGYLVYGFRRQWKDWGAAIAIGLMLGWFAAQGI